MKDIIKPVNIEQKYSYKNLFISTLGPTILCLSSGDPFSCDLFCYFLGTT